MSTEDTLSAHIQFDQALDLPASSANPQPYAAYFGTTLGQFDPARVHGATTVFALFARMNRLLDEIERLCAAPP